MARKPEDKQVNMLMSEEEKELLQKYCKDNNISIQQAMSKARELLLVDSLKNKAPEQIASIEDFELNLNSILTAFRSVLEHAINARAIAEQDVKEELKAMSDLVTKNTELNNDLQEKISENSKLAAQVKDLSEELEKLRNSSKDIDAISDENLKLKQQIADLQMRHNQEVKDLQEENFKKILQLVKAK